MIKPIPQSYEEFPSSSLTSEGMQIVPFEKGTHTSMKSIVYDPEENLKVLYITDEEVRPLILYVQGSAWMKQDLYNHVFELYEFSKRGYHIAITEYRDTSRTPFPGQIIDAKHALCYLFEHAEELKIRKDCIYLWGDSSGGHTVVSMAATDGLEGFGPQMPHIRAVLDFYGPTHIASMNDYPSTFDHIGPDSPEGRLIGRKNVLENKEEADRTIIMNYIEKDIPLPPIAIFHGSKDRLVPFAQSVELYEHLKKEKKEAVFYKMENADHGGIFLWHSGAMDLAERFLKQYV